MANTLAPFGFAQAYNLSGAPTYQMSRRRISTSNTTAIYRNDPVVQLNTGYIGQASSTSVQVAGIFAGCEYQSIAAKRPLFLNYWPGTTTDVQSGTEIICWVIDDPTAVFRVQSNGYGSAACGIANIGENVSFAIGTGNSSTGMSGATIDLNTLGTSTTTLQFRIVDLVTDPPGANGTDISSPYNWVYVTFNNADYRALTGI